MSNLRKSSDSTKDAVEALTILIESQGIDITANYSDWLRIAFALVDEFGLDGESYFHRISAFYPTKPLPSNTSIAYKAHIPL